MKEIDWLQMMIGLLGGLSIFLYGMRVMSHGLEAVGSDKMRDLLQGMTRHPLAGVGTGILVTALIQSSSATTVMLVSLVHAGFIQLQQAIGVIMGANIGTTITGWLVALIGFKVKITSFALPAVTLGIVFIFLSRGKLGQWGEICVGFGLLFLGLMFMQEAAQPLSKSQVVIDWMKSYSASLGYIPLIMGVIVGTLATVAIQSSSATMALTMTLAQQGVIDFPTAAALLLGENIGTTITANIAAISTNTAARQAARAHFLFNLLGVCWMLVVFYPFLQLIDWMVPGHVLSDNPQIRAGAIASHMAAYHTTFNIINTLLFLPLIGVLASIVTRILPDAVVQESKHILYLDARLVSTPALALNAARQELHRMAQHTKEMFSSVMALFDQKDLPSKPLVQKINKSEEILDAIEQEVAIYLTQVAAHGLTDDTSKEMAAYMNIAHNFEKIGDHCESILRYLRRRYDNKIGFSEVATEQLHQLTNQVQEFLDLLYKSLSYRNSRLMESAEKCEQKINAMRDEMREEHVSRLVAGTCDVSAGLIFIDLITSLEKIGDYAYNIAEYLSGKRYG
jgi:phosphate:Na+ symporter